MSKNGKIIDDIVEKLSHGDSTNLLESSFDEYSANNILIGKYHMGLIQLSEILKNENAMKYIIENKKSTKKYISESNFIKIKEELNSLKEKQENSVNIKNNR